MRHKGALTVVVGLAVGGYGLLYTCTVDRDHGFSRGSREVYHYRYISSQMGMYAFAPAAFLEARLIWVYPKAFLPHSAHSSWTETPQVLILRGPADRLRFRASREQE